MAKTTKPRRKRRAKAPFDEKFTIGEILFIIQYWHQRDWAWGRMMTEEELVASDVGVRLRRKMLKTRGHFDTMLTPGHFYLEPGEHGIGAPKRSYKPVSRYSE